MPGGCLLASLAVSIAAAGGYAQGIESRGPEIVAKHAVVMTHPPEHVPSESVVDGPLLGNGDLGVAIAGPPEAQRFYFGKNDFWSQQESPMSVGGLEISIPGLAGAGYRQEQDLLNAEVRGSLAKENVTVRLRSWTAATENLLVTEITEEGAPSIPVTVQLFPSGTKPRDNDKPVNLGREQHGAGRSYFKGLVSNVHLYDRALSDGEVDALKNLREVENGLIRRWNFDDREGKTPVDAPEKLVQSPGCSQHIVPRPEEWPTDQPSGCTMSPIDGFHYDWLRYLITPGGGRAPKFTHVFSYVDAGQVPLVKQVTVAAWIYIFSAGDANFILSKGDWNEAYSLQLDEGRLRFNIGDHFVRSSNALPTHQWIHVAGTFDGERLRAYIDGKEVIPEARFLDGGVSDGMTWITRNADGPLDQTYPWPDLFPLTATPYTKGRELSFVTRIIGADSTPIEDGLRFALEPGEKVFLVTPVLSDLDSPEHLTAAKQRAAALTTAEIDSLNSAHRQWWRQFWSESYVEIGDPVLEKFYYASQYIAACASRTGKTAPGLYGPWVTTDHPSWNGDYTLDYNYETPILALYSSNHLAAAGSFEPPLLDFMQRGEQYARTLLNARGIYFPGHIGPWGGECPTDYDPFMGMKSNAAFSVQPIMMRFYSTYDVDYANAMYPLVRKVGDFWEDYLKLENGRYVIDDCAEEVGPWVERPGWATCPYSFNPLNELGLLRTTFQGLIDMSEELGVDAERRAKWQHILDHLSAFPTGERDGKTVFRRAENSPITNIRDIFAIWPAGQIGLGSDPKLLEIARNTVATQKFSDFPLYAPILARITDPPRQETCQLSAR